MTPELSRELAAALHAGGDEPLAVVDPTTQHVYMVVDQKTHERAMDALRQRETEAAIRDGLADVHAGRSMTIDAARKLTEHKLHNQ